MIGRRPLVVAAAATALAAGVAGFVSEQEPTEPMPTCEWLAGDLDVHTFHTFTNLDEGVTAEAARSFALGVEEQAALATERGLDFIAITDYDTVAALRDPAFGGGDIIWLPGYEHPFPGIAQILGATARIPSEGPPLEAVTAVADEARRQGGLVQVGHPGRGWWPQTIGTSFRPDAVEVWFNGPWGYDPGEIGKNQTASMRFYDRLLDRGYHVAASGGSNSQHRGITKLAGVGQPTTWVCASSRTAAGILDGIGANRTSISHEFPSQGPLTDADTSAATRAPAADPPTGVVGLRNSVPQTDNPFAVIEGDTDDDGVNDATIGDTFSAGSEVTVGVFNAPFSVLRLVADDSRVVDQVEVFVPAFEHRVEIPEGVTWIRAELFADPKDTAGGPCPVSRRTVTYCDDRIGMLALTSPIYVAATEGSESSD
jgi:hypothetical protein